MKPFNCAVALMALTASLAYAQDISGDWQGTLKAGAQEIRLLVQIAKNGNGEWRATLLSIDQSPDRGVGVASVELKLSPLGWIIRWLFEIWLLR